MRSLGVLTLVLLLPVTAQAFMRSEESTRRWREDIEYARKEMPRIHKNLYHAISKETLDRSLTSLAARVPELEDDQIIAELGRVVASIGDGHTHLNFAQQALGYHALPVRFYRFRDGIFIRAATGEHASLAGAKVLRIGNRTAEDAWKEVAAITPRDNDSGLRTVTAFNLAIPEILHGLGITPAAGSVRLTLQVNGSAKEVELTPIPFPALFNGPLVDARPATVAWPLFARNAGSNFWFEYLAEPKVLYAKFNTVYWQKDEKGNYTSPGEFVQTVFAFADTHPVEKLIIDVRDNGGGNNTLNLPIIHGIIKRDALNARGKLFTIIGRETFSAAQNFINLMEKHTNTIFAGELSGGRPNHYGDPAPMTLPNSRIEIRLSTLWWQDAHPADSREDIVPQLFAESSSEDYKRGVDPVLEAVLRYRPLSDLLTETLPTGAEKTAKVYRAFKADPVNRFAETASEVNGLASHLIDGKRSEEAITILRLNLESYPKSPNAHHQLGSALLALGKREEAIREYAVSAELEPRNPYYREVLEKVKGGQ